MRDFGTLWIRGIINCILVAFGQLDEEVVLDRGRGGCLGPRGQFPHERFCDQYYNCWDEVINIETCPHHLLFNPDTFICDFAENVNCLSKQRNRKYGPYFI